jgi:limonene-1,2-epoxide hydrolase
LRSSLALGLVFAFLLTGCGGSSGSSVTSVVRAWSKALNDDDNQAAAKLFARGAQVVQGGAVLTLTTRADAVAFNESLPCSGEIVSLKAHGDTATATFRLGERKARRCDGPGQHATAVFRVRKGKIVLWHQTSSGSGNVTPAV